MATPSNNLSVGNLSSVLTDSDLKNLFSKYCNVHSGTMLNPSRNYALVCFNRIQDAKPAVKGLRGSVLRGNEIQIDFAKLAKPCKSLWVSGIGPSVTKETFREEFLKFGKIEEFNFIRDRKTASVDYFRLEDAFQALKGINGKQIGSDLMRVDFLRSHTSKGDQKPHSAGNGANQGTSEVKDDKNHQYLSTLQLAAKLLLQRQKKQHQSSNPTGQGSATPKQDFHQLALSILWTTKLNGQPRNVLWIGYPPSVCVDEQLLHNAMMMFGEVEIIRSFPSHDYSCVEFRSVDDAWCAKEGLQCRLFNDPRILIIYSTSDVGRTKDCTGFHPRTQKAKPCKSLWVSEISPSVTKETLQEEFLKFGKRSSSLLGTVKLLM